MITKKVLETKKELVDLLTTREEVAAQNQFRIISTAR
jgi:hypothetical protein